MKKLDRVISSMRLQGSWLWQRDLDIRGEVALMQKKSFAAARKIRQALREKIRAVSERLKIARLDLHKMYQEVEAEKRTARWKQVTAERRAEVLMMVLDLVNDQRRWVSLTNFKDRLDEAILFPSEHQGDYFTWDVEEEWRPTVFWQRALVEENALAQKRVRHREEAMKLIGAAKIEQVATESTDASNAELDRYYRVSSLTRKIIEAEDVVSRELDALNDTTQNLSKLIDRIWKIENASFNLLPPAVRPSVVKFFKTDIGVALRNNFQESLQQAKLHLYEEDDQRFDRARDLFLEAGKNVSGLSSVLDADPALNKLVTSGALAILCLPNPDPSFKTIERAATVASELLGISTYGNSGSNLDISDPLAAQTRYPMLDDDANASKITLGRQLNANFVRYQNAKAILKWLQDDLMRATDKGPDMSLRTINKAVDELAVEDFFKASDVLSNPITFASHFGMPSFDNGVVMEMIDIVKRLRDSAIAENRVLQPHEVYEAIFSHALAGTSSPPQQKQQQPPKKD